MTLCAAAASAKVDNVFTLSVRGSERTKAVPQEEHDTRRHCHHRRGGKNLSLPPYKPNQEQAKDPPQREASTMCRELQMQIRTMPSLHISPSTWSKHTANTCLNAARQRTNCKPCHQGSPPQYPLASPPPSYQGGNNRPPKEWV